MKKPSSLTALLLLPFWILGIPLHHSRLRTRTHTLQHTHILSSFSMLPRASSAAAPPPLRAHQHTKVLLASHLQYTEAGLHTRREGGAYTRMCVP